MTEARKDRAQAIFVQAVSLASDERTDFIERACAGDDGLRAAVEVLLANAGAVTAGHADGAAGGGPPDPPDGPDTMLAPVTEDAGTVIGRYKLLQKIGEGGFGVVYMAEQTEPVMRRVALKIIKLGMDTNQVIGRFEAERQALALMDHPNIASVFDGGATETGRPYFVMELVRGVPVTEYCDTHRLSTRARLELFTMICQAVQHAHQKGIIHRDIKPSNVLVTMQDGRPVPKVIDFGIAKATSQRLTERTVFTEFRQFIGTPEYMSPEQAEMSAMDIDTRADIYSLGVLLYELLTGTTPFDSKRLRSAAFFEVQRIIREEEPARPSTRLSGLVGPVTGDPDTAARIARQHDADPTSLSRLLRGDLDWVIMKAMDKVRARRYETASGLAEDIRRYLADEPVVARPPSARYRLGKLMRRNRGVFVAAGFVAAALLVGLAVALLGLIEANTARDREADARADAVRERDDARRARDESEAVTTFLTDMLKAVDPGQQGRDVSVREVLDQAAVGIGGRFADSPTVEARIRETIAMSFIGLGRHELAGPHLHRTVALREQALGSGHADTLAARGHVAAWHYYAGEYRDAERLYRAVLDEQRRLLGDRHPVTLVTHGNFGILLLQQGNFGEAESVLREALAGGREVLGAENLETIAVMSNLALLTADQGRSDEAAELYDELVALQERTIGPEHPGTLTTKSNLAWLLMELKRFEESEALGRATLEARRRVLGEEHVDTLTSMNNLGVLYVRTDRLDEAAALYRSDFEISSRTLGPEHPGTLVSAHNYARLLMRLGRHEEAERTLRESVDILRRTMPPGFSGLGITLQSHGECLLGMKRYDEAEEALVAARPILVAAMGEDHYGVHKIAEFLAGVYDGLGRTDDARRWRDTLPADYEP